MIERFVKTAITLIAIYAIKEKGKKVLNTIEDMKRDIEDIKDRMENR